MYKWKKKLMVFSFVILCVILNLRHLNSMLIILFSSGHEGVSFYVVTGSICLYNIYLHKIFSKQLLVHLTYTYNIILMCGQLFKYKINFVFFLFKNDKRYRDLHFSPNIYIRIF